jgi:hypothetical protein
MSCPPAWANAQQFWDHVAMTPGQPPKVGTKTITRTLSPAQLERYRPLFDNTKRLRELISELETLSARAVEQAEGWAAP